MIRFQNLPVFVALHAGPVVGKCKKSVLGKNGSLEGKQLYDHLAWREEKQETIAEHHNYYEVSDSYLGPSINSNDSMLLLRNSNGQDLSPQTIRIWLYTLESFWH